jgi:hypothetical protein
MVQHPVLVDRDLRRGQDVEVAVVEDAADEIDLEDRVVDLLEVRVRGHLVDDPGHLEQAAIGDHVLVRAPVPPAVEEEDDAGQDDDEGSPADAGVDDVGLVRRSQQDDDERQQADAPEEDRQARLEEQ